MLPGNDNQLGVSNGKRTEFSADNDLFKTIIIVLVLVLNVIFVGTWIYHFVNVQIRLHFSKFKRICRCLNLKVV